MKITQSIKYTQPFTIVSLVLIFFVISNNALIPKHQKAFMYFQKEVLQHRKMNWLSQLQLQHHQQQGERELIPIYEELEQVKQYYGEIENLSSGKYGLTYMTDFAPEYRSITSHSHSSSHSSSHSGSHSISHSGSHSHSESDDKVVIKAMPIYFSDQGTGYAKIYGGFEGKGTLREIEGMAYLQLLYHSPYSHSQSHSQHSQSSSHTNSHSSHNKAISHFYPRIYGLYFSTHGNLLQYLNNRPSYYGYFSDPHQTTSTQPFAYIEQEPFTYSFKQYYGYWELLEPRYGCGEVGKLSDSVGFEILVGVWTTHLCLGMHIGDSHAGNFGLKRVSYSRLYKLSPREQDWYFIPNKGSGSGGEMMPMRIDFGTWYFQKKENGEYIDDIKRTPIEPLKIRHFLSCYSERKELRHAFNTKLDGDGKNLLDFMSEYFKEFRYRGQDLSQRGGQRVEVFDLSGCYEGGPIQSRTLLSHGDDDEGYYSRGERKSIDSAGGSQGEVGTTSSGSKSRFRKAFGKLWGRE